MMRTKASRILSIILIIALLYSPRPVLSCGPYSPEAIFIYSAHPDPPLEKFVRGDLGIVQPTYAQSYLYVTYRYLSGMDFNEEEQKAIVALWNERLKPWLYSDKQGLKDWFTARNGVPGVGALPPIEPYSDLSSNFAYSSYLNCPEDALRTAASTLDKRIEQLGADSPEVKNWVRAQDQVFANCLGEKTIPAEARPDDHPLIRADRAYQIAAANFYAGNFDAAEKMFREIANDSSSPWRQIAPYLIARTLIRKATLSDPGYRKVDAVTLAQAEAQLKSTLGDSNLSAMHPAARRMLNFISFRLHPGERLHELAHSLLKKNAGDTLKQDLDDYTLLLDRRDLIGDMKKDDMTDWIFTFQSAYGIPKDHSLEKWKETSSLPWLLASLANMDAGHPDVPQVLEAAEKIKPDSPAFLSVAFYSMRLMAESGRKEEARKKLDDLLSQNIITSPSSSLNLFLALRMKLSRNLDEFLKYAQRVPAGFGYTFEIEEFLDSASDPELKSLAEERAVYLDADSVNVLNRKMPLSLLKDVAKSEALPVHIRHEVAVAVWTKSVLLGNEEIAREIVPVLSDLAPEMKGYLDAYLSAKNKNSRNFAAIFLMLNFPGTRPYIGSGLSRTTPLGEINHYRNNWWCSLKPDPEYLFYPYSSDPLRVIYPDGKLNFPDFLNEAEKSAAKEEGERLSSIDTAPNYLTRHVIEWAKKNPNDRRVPEALHLAVKSTRWGCVDKETSKFSKAAFQLLHKRYPKSIWAKKTKYWY